jgi:hypothetical protein
MAEESGTENPRGLRSDISSEIPAGIDPKEFKELIRLASQERKNLQLLVEYFDNKSDEMDERKQLFDRISNQVPDSLRKLDSFNIKFEEIKTFDLRIRDFELVSKELSSNYNTLKKDIDGLHLLNEHVDQKN